MTDIKPDLDLGADPASFEPFMVPELDDVIAPMPAPDEAAAESVPAPPPDHRSVTSRFRPEDPISWSKNGFIAYHVPTAGAKDNLLVTYLENVDGKSWQLAQPQRFCVKPNPDHSVPPELTFVQWSSLSTDLAVCDVFGNFYILLAGVALIQDKEKSPTPTNSSPNYELTSYNHLEFIYRDIINQQTSQSPNVAAQIVALEWLGIDKPQFLNKEAKITRSPQDQDPSGSSSFTYTYGVGQFSPNGLCHPIATKQACVALRRNGELILYYQGEHKVEYHKLTLDLAREYQYDLDISTASLGFDDDKSIVVVVHDQNSNKIRTYKVFVDWGYVQDSAAKQKVEPHYNTPKEMQKSPSMTSRLLHEMFPLIETAFENGNDDDDDGMDVDGLDAPKNSYKPSESIANLRGISVLGTSLRGNLGLDILVYYEAYDENFNWSSTIYMYKLVEQKQLVSSAFADLGSRKNVTGVSSKEPEYTLLLKGKLWRPKRIASVTVWGMCDQTCTIVNEDGEVDLFCRETMVLMDGGAEIDFTTYAPETINTLFDVGFRPPKIKISGKNPFLLGVSPLLATVAYIELNCEHQQLEISQVCKISGTGITARELFLTSVGFAFHHAFACYTSSCSDDLLLLIQHEIRRVAGLVEKMMPERNKTTAIIDRLIESVICESHKAINFQLDIFSKESVDKLLSNPPLQKLLSLQLILGDLQDRNHLVSNIAWIVLNLRSTSFAIMFSLSSIYRQISKKKPTEDTLQDSITRSEAIISLTGSVRWLVDTISYLNQEMIHLYLSAKNPEKSRLNYHNSLVLPLLISKVPRLFLMYALSSIGKTHEILKKLHKDLSDANKLFTPMKEALNRYFTACNNSPLNLNLFETFLRECDVLINKETTANSAGKSRGHSLRMEQKLVCQGSMNDETIKIAQKIVEIYLSKITLGLKMADVYYYDVDWINIGINRNPSDSESDSLFSNSHPILLQYPQPYKEMVPRHMLSKTECVDALRKVIISMKSDGLRKCTRCRSTSSVNDPLVYNSSNMLGLWTMVFQRTCVCGSAWISFDV